ncbi:hypothetical protein Zmor_025132 [Zophobas morio]|uniref:Uncharacterized protein n=1 Tax=Zophobas morio TaxID=2755281 RepID=A0AA38M3T1_9CUCU|nr:hypothetical protein Zmor_025132 [Zophobas morio]
MYLSRFALITHLEHFTDVQPILSVLKIDKPKGETVISVSFKRGSDEEAFQEETPFPVPKMAYLMPRGNVNEEHLAEGEDETPPEEPETRAPEPEPTTPSKSKKTRVQVDPHASVDETVNKAHYLTALPVVPESEIPYTPILYTFRVKTRGKATKLKHITTKPPPFYLQFDHAIAVIWTLFSKDSNKKDLGIVQLQWALHFLQSIYNDAGVHPKDVQLCIDAIQDYLINKYAEMSGEAVVFGSSTFGDFVEGDKGKCAPFSVNYSQMMKKCPRTAGLEDKESTMLDKQLLDELENVKKVVGIDSIDLTKVVSKDQVMYILNEWKREQIEKIQDELKMLYVVEDMMKNSDSQNFEGYTDESQFKTVFKKN